MVEGHVAD